MASVKTGSKHFYRWIFGVKGGYRKQNTPILLSVIDSDYLQKCILVKGRTFKNQQWYRVIVDFCKLQFTLKKYYVWCYYPYDINMHILTRKKI